MQVFFRATSCYSKKISQMFCMIGIVFILLIQILSFCSLAKSYETRYPEKISIKADTFAYLDSEKIQNENIKNDNTKNENIEIYTNNDQDIDFVALGFGVILAIIITLVLQRIIKIQAVTEKQVSITCLEKVLLSGTEKEIQKSKG